jgi:hypothetical protein
VFRTKALRRFLASLTAKPAPVLLDLGPVVGPNVSFFGEQLGCKILVESMYAEIDRHVRDERLEALPEFLERRFPQADGSIDGILCWDLIDFLSRPAAHVLARQLQRVLSPDGALFALFGATRPTAAPRYTKYVIVDESTLMYQPFAAARGPESSMPNRDILRLFGGLQVADSFLLQNNVREIVFRKPV